MGPLTFEKYCKKVKVGDGGVGGRGVAVLVYYQGI